MTGQELYIYLLKSNIINFIIMMCILVFVFKKAHLGKLIDNIADDIKNNVVSSGTAVQNALSEYKKTKREFKNIDTRKQEIIDNTKKTIALLEKSNKEDIEKKEQELSKNADKLQEAFYGKKLQKTTQDIQDAVYTLSLDAINKMDNNELQKRLIFSALDEFDKVEGAEKW